jgi:hypothetical protein
MDDGSCGFFNVCTIALLPHPRMSWWPDLNVSMQFKIFVVIFEENIRSK